MSHWNYRVVAEAKARRSPFASEELPHVEFSIIEAYYDDDGKLDSWCPAGDARSEDSAHELRQDLIHRLEAFKRPTLGFRDLPGGETVG